MKYVALITSIFISSLSYGFECSKHLPLGEHSSIKIDHLACHDGFALAYDNENKVPVWVAYSITADSVHGLNVKRKNNFRVDPNLSKNNQSKAADYKHSGYDRGHMAPSATIDYSRVANDDTFLYSNMAPQLAGFNRNMFGNKGVWGRLEHDIRKWVKKRHSLYVVSGTYFSGQESFVGNHVGIPSAFYKIVVDIDKNEAIAFWLPHEEQTAAKLPSYQVTISQIENKTGVDFFTGISDQQQRSLRNQLTYHNF